MFLGTERKIKIKLFIFKIKIQVEGKLTRETLLNRLYVLSPTDPVPVQDPELTARHGVCCL